MDVNDTLPGHCRRIAGLTLNRGALGRTTVLLSLMSAVRSAVRSSVSLGESLGGRLSIVCLDR